MQGVLYLADTTEQMGGFQCIPGFHNDLEWWIPRLAQYISMFPAPADGGGARRDDRIRRWQERLPPDADWVGGDPREWEAKHGTTTELTPLGRKLLGLDVWE